MNNLFLWVKDRVFNLDRYADYNFFPYFIQKFFIIRKDKKLIKNYYLKVGEININLLKKINRNDIQLLLQSKEYLEEWKILIKKFENKHLFFGSGSANIGDQQIIYYLIRHFKPNSVLEIGTHLGISTNIILYALNINKLNFYFDTVDIKDVNSSLNKNWVSYGDKYSPLEKIKLLNLNHKCNFIKDNSLNYLKTTKKKI